MKTLFIRPIFFCLFSVGSTSMQVVASSTSSLPPSKYFLWKLLPNVFFFSRPNKFRWQIWISNTSINYEYWYTFPHSLPQNHFTVRIHLFSFSLFFLFDFFLFSSLISSCTIRFSLSIYVFPFHQINHS